MTLALIISLKVHNHFIYANQPKNEQIMSINFNVKSASATNIISKCHNNAGNINISKD